MQSEHLNKFYLLAVFVLIVIILVSCGFIWSNRSGYSPLEITVNQASSLDCTVSVGGEVNSPGIYPYRSGDTIDSLILAAGGLAPDAEISRIDLSITLVDESQSPQKVDINRADIWLLEALPGIGESRAGAIVDYRQQNGMFRSIEELRNVPGIGESIFEQLEDYITVAED